MFLKILIYAVRSWWEKTTKDFNEYKLQEALKGKEMQGLPEDYFILNKYIGNFTSAVYPMFPFEKKNRTLRKVTKEIREKGEAKRKETK